MVEHVACEECGHAVKIDSALSDETKRAIEQAKLRLIDTITSSMEILIAQASNGLSRQIETAADRINEEILNAELEGTEHAEV